MKNRIFKKFVYLMLTAIIVTSFSLTAMAEPARSYGLTTGRDADGREYVRYIQTPNGPVSFDANNPNHRVAVERIRPLLATWDFPEGIRINALVYDMLYIIHQHSPSISTMLMFEAEHRNPPTSERSIVGGYIVTSIINTIATGDRFFSTLSTIAHYRAHWLHMSGARHITGVVTGGRSAYLVSDDFVIVSVGERGFPLTESAGVLIPEALRTRRWSSYVSPGARPDSNRDGVFGLLNELDAYYRGFRITVDATEFLLTNLNNSNSQDDMRAMVLGYFNTLQNNVLAVYEFTYWSLVYLLYVQEHHPSQFTAIMANENYRKVFIYVYNNAMRLIDELPELQNTILTRFEAVTDANTTIIKDERGIWTRTNNADGSRSSRQLLSFGDNHQHAEMLRNEISRQRYTEMLNTLLLTSSQMAPIPTETANQPSSWAIPQVNAAISAGLVPQSLQSQYTQATTRAEFAALAVALYETVTGTEITGRVQFNDTSDINVQKMGYLGVVTGVGGGNFAPNSTLTREQAATMLTRLAEAIGQPLPPSAPTFADNAQISSWAVDGVGQMQESGIMGGVGDNQFSPNGDYTREQSIVTMMRLFDLLN